MTAPSSSSEVDVGPAAAADPQPRYSDVDKVRPGITGWAQVNGFRGETATVDKMVERVACDLEYIRRWTFGFDLKIVWSTVFGSGARSNAY